jgi:hypothetical protein
VLKPTVGECGDHVAVFCINESTTKNGGGCSAWGRGRGTGTRVDEVAQQVVAISRAKRCDAEGLLQPFYPEMPFSELKVFVAPAKKAQSTGKRDGIGNPTLRRLETLMAYTPRFAIGDTIAVFCKENQVYSELFLEDGLGMREEMRIPLANNPDC